MPITRTNMIDDDGSGTTGTILNNAWLQTIYNQIDADPAVVGYVPPWYATGTAPSLGNGTLTGAYVRLGQLVVCTIALTIGSTTGLGAGAWYFGLPPLGTVIANPILTVELFDSAVGSYMGVGVPFSGPNVVVYATGAPNGVGPTAPFTFKAGDHVFFNGPVFFG